MAAWYEPIVQQVVPHRARVTAVSDPDALFRDPRLCKAIQDKGFTIIQYDDPISFRFDYESRFRSSWNAGDGVEVVVVFNPGEDGFDTLPADVSEGATRLSFSIRDVFPRLSYSVATQLEPLYYEPLYQAHQQYATTTMDETQSWGFVLRHVFRIEPVVIKDVPDLLRMLCDRHYRKLSFPVQLDAFLIKALRQNTSFSAWPLEQIIPSASSFWEFVNERWPVFVAKLHSGAIVLKEPLPPFKYEGPADLPFDHDSVRIHIDNLFEEGLLTPVSWDWSQKFEQTWIRVGLLGNKVENTDLRFEELSKNLLQDIPTTSSSSQDWLKYAYRYAQARKLWTQIGPAKRAEYQAHFPELCSLVNQAFYTWLLANYGGIFNYPSSSPLMVHHIPGYIAHQLTNKQCQKAAFILVDGLAIDQWLIIKDVLRSERPKVPMEENALFAWIPSITPISRQAAYSGKLPRYFADTIHRTDRDEAGWRHFWADHHLTPAEIAFAAVPGNEADLAAIDDLITSQTRALGITLYKVDQIMHGIELGMVGMAGQVRTWAEEGFLTRLLGRLFALGFDVFISADHGNTEAIGIGTPREGALVDKGGERCRIYAEPSFTKSCVADFPGTLEWSHPGLPDAFSTLLAPHGKAYTQAGSTLLGHGGPSLEEVCVPFIWLPAGKATLV
jgi:hypothetical protein